MDFSRCKQRHDVPKDKDPAAPCLQPCFIRSPPVTLSASGPQHAAASRKSACSSHSHHWGLIPRWTCVTHDWYDRGHSAPAPAVAGRVYWGLCGCSHTSKTTRPQRAGTTHIASSLFQDCFPFPLKDPRAIAAWLCHACLRDLANDSAQVTQ